MSLGNKSIPIIPLTVIFSLILLSSTYAAGIQCSDVKYGAPKYDENMDELAKGAGLPDGYWNRDHQSVIYWLCNGDTRSVDKLVENGYVKTEEVQGIARVLGIAYKVKPRSQMGKRFGNSMDKFLEMGACTACASHIAEYYTKKPNSRCGKLAKHALEGDPEAIKELVAFPEYCQWK